MLMHQSCGRDPNYNGLFAEMYLHRHEAFRTPQFPNGLGDIGDVNIPGLVTTGATLGVFAGAAIAGATSIAGMSVAAIAGPIGAAAGLVAMAVISLINNSGCGETCTISTKDANAVADALQQLVDAYHAGGHTKTEQAATLQSIDQAFAALRQACGDPRLGDAGKRCISERLVRGGTAPWCPNPGHTGCDWYALYRDPIANDPSVVPDPMAPSVTSGVENVFSSVTDTVSSIFGGMDMTTLLMIAAAGLFIFSSQGQGRGR